MLKNRRNTALPSRLGMLLLTIAVILLPCKGATPTLSTLYNFTDLSDGGFPEAGLAMNANGALFGTTSTGGQFGWGTVFELEPTKTGGWIEKTIYSFTGGMDGANPISDLAVGTNNVLYGTTYYGGVYDSGTVFQLAPVAGGGWSQKVLYSFGSTSGDGANPAAGLVLGSAGALYGTTYGGGTTGMGTVFVLVPSGGGWTEKILWTFLGGTDGANPLTDLALGSNGAIFGTTAQGGSVTNANGTYEDGGTIFELTNSISSVWSESVLYTFTGGSDGGYPASALIIGPNGTLYGSTFWGGTPAACAVGDYPKGCGVIYQLAPPTGGPTSWTQTVLHTFTGHSPDGSHPYRNMALNAGGVLFGTTYSGGANVNVCYSNSFAGCGTIFTVKPPKVSGGAWTKLNLTVFPGSPGSGTPSGVIMSKGGILYGTTIVGGTQGGYGTVFKMTP